MTAGGGGAKQAQRDRDHDKLVKGVGLNFLGSLGRVLVPAFYILANQVYGPSVFGLYALAISPMEILVQFVVTGFADAIQRFTARDADTHEAHDAHYAVLWRCLWWVFGASAFAIGVVALAGKPIAEHVWGRADLYPVLVMFACNVPIVGVMTLLLAAARAVMDMRGDALVRGLVAPLLLMLSAVAMHPLVPSVYGLGLALTISNLIAMGASIWYFSRHYSLARLWAARRLPAPAGLLGFAVPQSINMTMWQGIWNLDVLMLAAYVDNASLGLYRTVAEIARVVFSIRFSFSTVYAPLVARYTLDGDHRGMQDSYTRLSRWIATIAAPAVVVLVLFQRELLWLFSPAYAGGATFMWLLLIGPLLACVTGLSGNILVMTGHHLWNLANSAVLLGVNVALNLVLIPRYGMTGAALATMVGISGATLLQIAEVHYLLGVRVQVARIYKPLAAAAAALAVAHFAGVGAAAIGGHAVALVAEALALLAVYAATLLALRLEPEDAETLARWKARRSGRAAGGP